MDLRLVLEEAFVAGLAERGSGIHDGFGEGVVGDAAVGGEIVGVPRLPARRPRRPGRTWSRMRSSSRPKCRAIAESVSQ